MLSMFLNSRLLICRRLLEGAAAALRMFPRSSATVVVEECVVRLAQCILLTVFHTRLLFAPASAAIADSLTGKDGQPANPYMRDDLLCAHKANELSMVRAPVTVTMVYLLRCRLSPYAQL